MFTLNFHSSSFKVNKEGCIFYIYPIHCLLFFCVPVVEEVAVPHCVNTLLQVKVLHFKFKYKSISIKMFLPKVKALIMQNGPFHNSVYYWIIL